MGGTGLGGTGVPPVGLDPAATVRERCQSEPGAPATGPRARTLGRRGADCGLTIDDWGAGNGEQGAGRRVGVKAFSPSGPVFPAPRAARGPPGTPPGPQWMTAGPQWMAHSKERMTHSKEWMTHSKERMAHSKERTAHSKERMTHSQERIARSMERTPHSKGRMTRSQERMTAGQPATRLGIWDWRLGIGHSPIVNLKRGRWLAGLRGPRALAGWLGPGQRGPEPGFGLLAFDTNCPYLHARDAAGARPAGSPPIARPLARRRPAMGSLTRGRSVRSTFKPEPGNVFRIVRFGTVALAIVLLAYFGMCEAPILLVFCVGLVPTASLWWPLKSGRKLTVAISLSLGATLVVAWLQGAFAGRSWHYRWASRTANIEPTRSQVYLSTAHPISGRLPSCAWPTGTWLGCKFYSGQSVWPDGNTWAVHSALLPPWELPIPFLLYPLFALLLGSYRLLRRIPTGHCQKCGYDLTGNVSGRCPECGSVITAVSPPSGP